MINGSDRQSGMTLVELLVAMAMSGLLVAGMYSVYISMQRTNYNQEDIVDTQQSLRVAMEAMARDIRMAGACVDANSAIHEDAGENVLALNLATTECIEDQQAAGILTPVCHQSISGETEVIVWRRDGRDLKRNQDKLADNLNDAVGKGLIVTYLDSAGEDVTWDVIGPGADDNDRNLVASIRIQLELLADKQSAADDVPRSLVSVVRLMNRK